MVSTSDIFNVLSDNNSLMLFNAIASKSVEELIPKLNINEKQCTAIISVLTNVGLVRKQSDKIYLTSLGKVFHYAYLKLSNAMDNSWKLKCIDILEESDKVPRTEIHHIINIVIGDNIIREILKGEA
jgi:predicted transcriptional regulator